MKITATLLLTGLAFSCGPTGSGSGSIGVDGHIVKYAHHYYHWSDPDFRWIVVTDVTEGFSRSGVYVARNNGTWILVPVVTSDVDVMIESLGDEMRIHSEKFSLSDGGLFFVAVGADPDLPYVQVRQSDMPLPQMKEGDNPPEVVSSFLDREEVRQFLDQSAKELSSRTW